MKQETVYGYAWEIKEGSKWVLCHWMEPDRYHLSKDEKPSPEARMVAVKMTRRSTKA
jgi:hypothetical protein